MPKHKIEQLFFVISILLLALIPPGFADDVESEFSENEIKAAVEYTATLGVCSDSTLLELSGIQSSNCETRLSNFSTACWHQLNGLDLNYELAQNESSKEMFIGISLVYESCIRSELLRKIVRKKRDSDRCEESED